MKKWLESRLIKAVVIALACLSAGGLVLSVLWAVAVPSIQMEDLLMDGKGNGFWESSTFRSELMEKTRLELEYYRNSWMLNDKGEIDREALVEIGPFSGRGYPGNIVYTLGEVLDWSRQMDQGQKKTIVTCQRTDGGEDYFYLEDFRSQFDEGKLVALWNKDDGQDMDIDKVLDSWESSQNSQEISYVGEYSEEPVWDQGYYVTVEEAAEAEQALVDEYLEGIVDQDGNRLYTDFWIYQGSQMAEFCQPQGGASLLELVNKNQWELSEVFDILYGEIAGIAERAEACEARKYERAQDTNVDYLYVDLEQGKAYSNRPEYKKYKTWENSLEQVRAQGSYTWLTNGSRGSDYGSTMNGGEDSWRGLVEHTLAGDRELADYVFAVAVDTSLPVRDWAFEAQENFLTNGIILRKALGGCGACGILLLASLVWLTLGAGHSKKQSGTVLNFFDRYKTEVGAALVLLAWAITSGALVQSGIASPSLFTEYIKSLATGNPVPWGRVKFYCFLVVLCFGTAALMFLWGYLSLVRRCKARTLWKNSILRLMVQYGRRYGARTVKKIFVYMKKAFSGLRTYPRKIIALGAFLALQLFYGALVLGNSYYDGTIWAAIILWLLTSLAGAVWIGKVAVEYAGIQKGIRKIADGDIAYQLSLKGLTLDRKTMAEDVNRIGEGLDQAVEKSLRSERMKTELITNVSHDIKTPLTSIINYVDLLKREQIPGEQIQEYLDILEKKSYQLKNLTEDVVEASKASTGNLVLQCEDLDLVEMLLQVNGEFQEKFDQRELSLVLRAPENPVVVWADGRRMWRILENIYQNAAKYAMPRTRVYVELSVDSLKAVFTMKNISEDPLDISPDELTERFVRGDSSRNTQGSGLGLSIARSLTELQSGEFQLFLDGDLFKVQLSFPLREK